MALGFHKLLNPISPEIFPISGPRELRAGIEGLLRKVELDGYAIVRAWDTSPETLLQIARQLGRIQRHPKADADGVVTVRPEREPAGQGFERNVSKTAAEFQLHTDGAFIDGVVAVRGALFRMGPPSLFLLQCVQPAEEGGTSVLVDTQEVLAALREEAPIEARIATESDVLTYFGGDQTALDFPFFQRQRSGAYRFRFRADLAAVSPWAKHSVRKIVEEYLLGGRFEVRFQLEAGDILIVDNHRMLHGRDAIALGCGGPARTLRRTWIWDERNPELAPLGGAQADRLVSPAMGAYTPIDNDQRPRLLALGVKI